MQRPISAVSYVTLRYIKEHRISISSMAAFRQMVLYSLLYRGYIQYTGNYLIATAAGRAELERYGGVNVNIWRKQRKEISQRIARLVRKSRSATV